MAATGREERTSFTASSSSVQAVFFSSIFTRLLSHCLMVFVGRGRDQETCFFREREVGKRVRHWDGRWRVPSPFWLSCASVQTQTLFHVPRPSLWTTTGTEFTRTLYECSSLERRIALTASQRGNRVKTDKAVSETEREIEGSRIINMAKLCCCCMLFV